MALQCDVILDNGLEVNNAYIAIRSLEQNQNFTVVSIEAYKNRDWALSCRSNNIGWLKCWIFKIPKENLDWTQNTPQQIYDYLKTLPQFNGAIDI